MASETTWLVMLRDVSKTVRVKGKKRLAACMVLEMESGDMLAVQVGSNEDEALSATLEGAATGPAGPHRPRLPDRILFGPEIAVKVANRIRELGEHLELGNPDLLETPAIPDAEDIFDSFIGHMSGRAQPREFASSDEWRMLYGLARGFHDAEPWQRWADNVDLRLELVIGRSKSTFAAVIIGNEGIQRGLVMYPGSESPPGLREWKEGMKVPMPDGTLIFHLDPRKQPPQEFLGKADRYGWPRDAEFVPVFLSMVADGPEDVGREEVLRLALGISAVVELDDRGPVVADRSASVSRRLQLPGGTTATFEIKQRPPEQPEPGALKFRMHQVGLDLVPRGSPVSMGSMPVGELAELRKRAKIHRPAPAPPPAGMQTVPLIAIHPRRASGEAIASRIANDDPFGVSLVEDGGKTLAILACAEGAHALMEIPSDAAALALFQLRMQSAVGFHVLVVADEETTRTTGTIYGMFECVTPVEPPTRMASASRRAPKSKKRGRRR